MLGTLSLSAQHITTPINSDDVMPSGQWKGTWIGVDSLTAGEVIEGNTKVLARYLRKEFALQKKEIRRARAFVAVRGYYELYVNGRKIGNQVLSPIQSDFRKSLTYNVLDVTEAMDKTDVTCVGLILGNGRSVSPRNEKRLKYPFFGLPQCMVNVVVDYADGTSQCLYTSDMWKSTTNGPVRYNNEYDGEEYDARLEMDGWSEAGYDDRAWQKADVVDKPTATLYPQTTENQIATPLDEYAGIAPLTLWKKDKATYVDVKQNIAGWLAVRVRGNKGDTIRVKYAEKIKEDSTLYTANLRKSITEDMYICNGEEGEGRWWTPRFVYHGFQYARITGLDGISPEDIKAYVVANEIKTIGSFKCNNEVLNRIYRNAWWGILDNYKGFPVDCPQRDERMPWLGDRTAGSLGESFLFDNNRLYTHWMRDICDAQRKDGTIPDVAPGYWVIYSDNVTWPAALPFTCEMLYRQYGNDEAIRNSYPYIKRWIDHIVTKRADSTGVIIRDKYGDWCMPPEKLNMIHSKDPSRITDGALLSTAYMIRIMRIMSDFATMQGLSDDARRYASDASTMQRAFNNRFLHVEGNNAYYGNNTATANILALAFDIVPAENKNAVIANVRRIIEQKHNCHVSCGVIGISHMMRTLTANGMEDLAWRIATNTTYPSWGYMVENGATTIWELWNGNTANPAMNSGNHVMLLGDLLAWIYEDLAGIRNAKGSIAYKRLDMAPAFNIAGLDNIEASYITPQGRVESAWSKKNGLIEWTVSLPKGVSATCYLPNGEVKEVKGGKPVTLVAAPDVPIAKYKGDRKAAVSYTFDDGLAEHYTLLFPELEKRGIKGTLAINGRNIGGSMKKTGCMTWEQVSEMAAAGHEISNHGWAHQNLRKITTAEMREEVQHNDTAIYNKVGVFPRTFVYPYNAKSAKIEKFCSEERAGTRTFQVSIGSKRSEQWMNEWVDGLIDKGEWGVGMTHGITVGYDAFGDPTRFWHHLDYAVSLKDSLWIATFYEVAAYNALRDDVKLSIKAKKNSLTITPKTTLDEEIYHSQLTLVIETDRPLTAKQDGKTLSVECKDGRTLVYFNPHGGKIKVKMQ